MRRFLLLLACLAALPFGRAPKFYQDLKPLGVRTMTYFDTTNGLMTVFSGGAGNCHVAIDSTLMIDGHASTRLIADSGKDCNFAKYLGGHYNTTGDSFFTITQRFPSKNSMTRVGKEKFYHATTSGKFASYDAGGSTKDTTVNMWGHATKYTMIGRKFTTTGAYDRTHTDTLLIELLGSGGADTVTVAKYESMHAQFSTAVFLQVYDDAWDSIFTYGLPTIDSLPTLRVTIAANCKLLGQPNKLSFARLDTMVRKRMPRFAVINHLFDHDTATTISLDSFRVDYFRNADIIKANHWGDGENIFVYPYGRMNRATDSSLRSWGAVYGRLTLGNTEGEAQPFYNQLNTRCTITLSNGITLAQAEAVIDDAILSHATINLLAHKLCNSCTLDANTWIKSDYQALMHYAATKIAAGTLVSMTVPQYYKTIGGGLGPRRRLGIGPQ